MKKIICGIENIKAFQGELRAAVPVFHALAKQLHSHGLIIGLRGAILETGIINQPIIEPEKIEIEEKTCEQCQNWQRDTIGDGTGMGICQLNINPKQLKWPGIPACNDYSAI